MRNLAVVLALGLSGWASAASIPAAWQFSQDLNVSKPGLAKTKLPSEVASNAQASLGDLRLLDGHGRDVAFYVDQTPVQAAQEKALETMQGRMEKGKTVIWGKVPYEFSSNEIDAVVLYTQTEDFLKAVTVEGSKDQRTWTPLVVQTPVFQPSGGSASVPVEFPKGRWAYLRLTLDDVTTPPIRVLQIGVRSPAKTLMTPDKSAALVQDTSSDAHQTEIRAQLSSDHLSPVSIQLSTPETSFRRTVRAYVKVFVNGTFQEQLFGQGLIYRVTLGNKRLENLSIPFRGQLPGRELILRIENGDSRPLAVQGIQVETLPAFLVFDAPAAGAYTLTFGNPTATPQTYDVAGLRSQITGAAFQTVSWGAPATNAAYHAPDPMPQVEETGTDVDVSAWPYRKPVTVTQNGIQRLELDLPASAHSARGWADLRLVRTGRQLPYVLDPSGMARSFSLEVVAKPTINKTSVYQMTLPLADIPLQSLRFTVEEPLFQRNIRLYEETLDERGDTVKRPLGQVTWTRVNGEMKDGFTLFLNDNVRGTRLILEIDNGDNPPLHVQTAEGYYRAMSLVFKAAAGPGLYLYYGQKDVTSPQYDLQLIAAELLNTVPIKATLGAEEILKVQPWWEVPLPTGKVRGAFWLVMGLVVLGLLWVIAKLLPVENEKKGDAI